MGENNGNIYICAYNRGLDCRILDEKICLRKKCNFYKTCKQYENELSRDFLYEYYQKDRISKERYRKLRTKYHTVNKKIRLPKEENGG